MKKMSYIAVPTPEDVTPEINKLWSKAGEKMGFIPNVFKAQALNPEQFWAWWKYFDLLVNKEGFLTPLEREMVAVVVSSANRCIYCLVSHSAAVRVMSGNPQLGDLLSLNFRHAPVDERMQAMFAFAHKLTVSPVEMTEADLTPLKAHGLSDQQILELTQVIGMFNMTNRISAALGFVPNDEYYAMAR